MKFTSLVLKFANTCRSDPISLPEIKFGSINVRSLNLSNKSNNLTIDKLNFILDKGHDIIALSEVKFFDHGHLPWINRFLKTHKEGPFKMILNSSKSARGCAIIFKSKLNLSITATIRDPEENFLLIDSTLNDIAITIGAVYAPNENPLPFFKKLKNEIDKLGSKV